MAPRGPSVTRSDAFNAVRQLRRLAVEAEDHVAAFTGMAAGHPHEPANVVERSGWIKGNVGGFQVVMAPLLEKLAAKQAGKFGAPLVSRVGSRAAGMQIGLLLAYLSGKILGQYELFLPPDEGRTPGRPPHLGGAQHRRAPNGNSAPTRATSGCGCACTRSPTAPSSPPCRGCAITCGPRSARSSPRAISTRPSCSAGFVRSAMRSATTRGSTRLALAAQATHVADPPTLLDAVQTPEQRAILNRLTAVMTLLEGHGEYVMNGVGPSVIPSVDEIGRKFSERRRGQNPADRLVRKLFGLDMKAKQYAEGAAFVRAVVEQVGMASFNRVWTSPNTLPNRAEIADPAMWMKRVLRTSKNSDRPTGEH